MFSIFLEKKKTATKKNCAANKKVIGSGSTFFSERLDPFLSGILDPDVRSVTLQLHLQIALTTWRVKTNYTVILMIALLFV